MLKVYGVEKGNQCSLQHIKPELKMSLTFGMATSLTLQILTGESMFSATHETKAQNVSLMFGMATSLHYKY